MSEVEDFYRHVEKSKRHRDDLIEWFEAWQGQVERDGFLGFEKAQDVTIPGFNGYRCLEIGLVDIDYSDLEINVTSTAIVAAEALYAIDAAGA